MIDQNFIFTKLQLVNFVLINRFNLCLRLYVKELKNFFENYFYFSKSSKKYQYFPYRNLF